MSLRVRCSAGHTGRKSRWRESRRCWSARARFSGYPTTGASGSCQAPTPAPSRWLCGRCSARAAVDFLSWDNFGALWATDGERELRPLDARVIDAPYGRLPELGQVDPNRDTVFVWNGTTSGVRVPDAEWIAADRAGLTLCDATSAIPRLPDGLDQARCDHVLLAEGAGWRGRVRHADPGSPCRGAAGERIAALAGAQGLPPYHRRWPAQRRHFPGARPSTRSR